MRTRFPILFVLLLVLAVVPLAPVAATTGTMYMDEDTVLTEDHYGQIEIVAEGKTLDCNGYSVVEPEGDELWAGVLLEGRTGVTVKNCHVLGFEVAVLLSESHHNTIKNNSLTASGENEVLVLHESHDNTIMNNTATNPYGGQGFGLWYSDRNLVIGNTAYSANALGFVLVESDDNVFKSNTAEGDFDTYDPNPDPVTGWHGGDGYVIAGSVGNLFEGNRAHNFVIAFHASEWDGIQSHSNVFRNNLATHGELGFWLVGSAEASTGYNMLRGNTAVAMNTGFDLRFAVDNTIVGNKATDNRGNGFELCDWSTDNVVTNNCAIGNGQAGFQVCTSSTNNTLEKNTARHNKTGFLLTEGSTGNTLADNRIRDNELGFLAWDGSSGNTVRDNRFCHNGFDMRNSPDSIPTFYIDNKVCGAAPSSSTTG